MCDSPFYYFINNFNPQDENANDEQDRIFIDTLKRCGVKMTPHWMAYAIQHFNRLGDKNSSFQVHGYPLYVELLSSINERALPIDTDPANNHYPTRAELHRREVEQYLQTLSEVETTLD